MKLAFRLIITVLLAVFLLFLAPSSGTRPASARANSAKCDYCSCWFTDDVIDKADATTEDEEPGTAENNLQQHLVRIVDCDNGRYWETCEHGVEAAVLRGVSPKTK